MKKISKKITQHIAFVLCVALMLQLFVTPYTANWNMTAEAADSSEPITYEDDFEYDDIERLLASEQWDIESDRKKDATAPIIEDGVIKMTSKNSIQFNWESVPGIIAYDDTKTYTFEFDATMKSLGDDSSWGDGDHTRVLYVANGGWFTQVELYNSKKEIKAAGNNGILYDEAAHMNNKLHIKLEWSETTVKTTITNEAGKEIVTSSRTVSSYYHNTDGKYLKNLVLRCEDGAVEIDNFAFTDGTTNYIQSFGDPLSSSVWDVELDETGVNKKKDATAPILEDGVIKMRSKNSIQFNWESVPGIGDYDPNKTYTFEFDARVTDSGINSTTSYWGNEDHTRVLYVAPGGYINQLELNTKDNKIKLANSNTYSEPYDATTYMNQKIHIKLEWTVKDEKPTITTTITDADGKELIKGSRTVPAYDDTKLGIYMKNLVLRCEDGAVEIDNFVFSVDNAIRYKEDFGVNSNEMMFSTAVWDVENQENGNTHKKGDATAPILEDGVIKMQDKNSIQFNWKNVPGIGGYDATKIYTFEFDATVKNSGEGSWWGTNKDHTRVLYVAPGGYYNQVEILPNYADQRVFVGGKYFEYSDASYLNQKIHIKVEWIGNEITTTITDENGAILGTGTRTGSNGAYANSDDIHMHDLVLRCEDGAVEIDNFRFAKTDANVKETENQINIPEKQQAVYKCTVHYNTGSVTRVKLEGTNSSGTAVSGNLFEISDNGLSIGGYACAGTFEPGEYKFTVYLNPEQKSANVEVKLPDDGVIRRGSYALLYGAANITKINAYTWDLTTPLVEEVTYNTINQEDYELNTEEPAYEGFEVNVHNLVTSFDGDAKTTRTFAWTALESYIGNAEMSLRYKASGTDEWQMVAAVREIEKTECETEDYFKADIKDLEPGTTYLYQIGKTASQVDWSPEYSFTTEEKNIDEFSFVAIGDTQGTNWNGTTLENKGMMYAQAALQKAVAETENPAFILHTGDIAEKGSEVDQWNLYFKALGNYGTTIPHFAAVGNHDTWYTSDNFDLHFNHPDNGGKNAFAADTLAKVQEFVDENPGYGGNAYALSLMENLDETVYSWNYGDVHFVVLNTGVYYNMDDIILEGQREWLKKDLEANRDADWTVFMIHQPVYHRKGGVESRPWLHDIIEEYGVDLVLQGHSHLVTRTYPMKDGNIVSKSITDTIEKGTGTVYTTVGATTTNHDGLSNGIEENMYTVFTPDTTKPTYTTVTVKDSSLKVTVKQVDGLVVDEFVLNAPKVEYEYFDNISNYRGATKSYEDKEGYVFAGWWQGDANDVITDDTNLIPISEGTKDGGAWAKYVPEETLSVKAQTTNRITDNPASTKLRLVTTVDSLRYKEVGFKIKYNQGQKEYTHSSKNVYEKITALDANDIPFNYRPGVFDNVSDYFMAYTITDINQNLFDTYEFAVSPYWITLDGTTVRGVARERLLVSDQLANNTDGRDFTVEKSTYTYATQQSPDQNVSYQYFAGASDTVYVEGTYTKADANDQFGLSIRNGGEERQIFFVENGVKVVNKTMNVTIPVEESQIIDKTTINTMISKGSGAQVKITWEIVGNILSCSLDGTEVYTIDMTALCGTWKPGRHYQMGVAGYNTDTTTAAKFVLEEFNLGK